MGQARDAECCVGIWQGEGIERRRLKGGRMLYIMKEIP